MNGRKPALLTPALVGGVAAGVLSGVPFLNCLCCLWIIGGAILACYLLAKDSPRPLSAGDGALVGAFTGITAAVVESLLSIPLAAINAAFMHRFLERMADYVQEMPAGWDRWLNRSIGPFSLAWFFLGLIITAAIFAVLGALGGVIGMSVFGKKTLPPSPAPPLPPQPGSPS